MARSSAGLIRSKAAYASSNTRRLPSAGATRSSIRTDARLDFSTGMTFLGAGLGRTW
jgi:hypothetical protein